MKISTLQKVSTASLIIFCFNLCAHAERSQAEEIFLAQVLLGDLSNIAALLAGVDGADKVLEKFNSKFIDNQHGIEYEKIADPLIRDILRLYQNYWREALLFPDKMEFLEEQLQKNFDNIINRNGKFTEKILLEEESEQLSQYIIDRGYHSLIGGRTKPFFEFMLWKNNEDHEYKIRLTDSVHTIKVTHIGDFINKGWIDYSTSGAGSTGGWALKDKLVCVCDRYDKNSEAFEISYLKHEARHFADYKQYPNLEQSTLEYRAKLTELAFANRSSHKLLANFAMQGRKDGPLGHPLASWHVNNNLQNLLNPPINDENVVNWEATDVERIQSAARELLEANDEYILNHEREKTVDTIFPLEG